MTSRQLLVMLDGSLPPPHFFERNKDGSRQFSGWDEEEETFAHIPLDDDSDDDETYGRKLGKVSWIEVLL